jgi:hypothetical protein
MSTSSGAPPGWFADPGGSTDWRWWDGSTWTAFTAPRTGFDPRSTLPVYPPRQPPDVSVLFEAEERVARWAARAALLAGAGAILGISINALEASAWRRYFHSVRLLFQRIGTPGYVAQPAPHAPLSSYLASVFLIPGIVFLVWQYRAATTASALGYPSRHEPGWGVGAWFVPIVNFWIPYGAMRDCLPPGHPLRRRGWLPWVLYLMSGLFSTGAIFAVAEAHTFGLILDGVIIVIDAWVFFRAYLFVRAVSADHRARVMTLTH